MSARLLVVLRLCPDCGRPLRGAPGVPWMSCDRCPLAFDPFAQPAARMATYRPEGTGGDDGPRLAFYAFETGPTGGPWVWVPAFRVAGTGRGADPGRVLSEKGYRPALVEAPLSAGIARTPEEADRLLRRVRPELGGDAAVRGPWLVSLPCRLSFGTVSEQLSGLSWPKSAIRPPVSPGTGEPGLRPAGT